MNLFKKKGLIFSIIFLAYLGLQYFSFLGFIEWDFSMTTMQKNNARPTLNGLRNFSKFLSEYDAYYKDNFSFRKFYIYSYNKALYSFLNISGNKDVVIGKNDMMFFFSKNSGDPLGDFRGINFFTEDELRKIKSNLELREVALAKKGIKFYLLLLPNKESVHPENVPDSIKKYKNRNRMDQLVEYLKNNSKINLITVKDELIEKKKNEILFLNTDSHWNELGAFYAYKKTIDTIAISFPQTRILQKKEFNIESKIVSPVGGDLARTIGLEQDLKDNYIYFNPIFKPEAIQKFSVVEPHNFYYSTGASNRPNVYFFCDSFVMYGMVQYLKESFNESYFIWTSLPFNPAIVENKKIDIMVLEFVERYVPQLLKTFDETNNPLVL